jgi:Fe-S oxidoreductase
MSKEGSTQAPTRHPLKFRDPDFVNPEKIDQEMRRVFDICHGCRRCFNLCDSFPKLFDFIDETEGGEVSDLSSDKFKPVVDACTLCDMCFMTKCPYVPPHEFDLDFPHLMLRYRTAQRKNGDISKTDQRKVVIYSTCFVNFNKKKTGEAALKVLHHNNVEVEHSYAGCCGMPYLEQADLDQVTKQAQLVSRELNKYIEKGFKVVTLTASCGLMLKFEWPLLMPNDGIVKKLSQNTLDIDEYVVDIANKEGLVDGLKEIDGGVTVHNACHARAQNMGNKARDMLKLIPNIKLDVVERCAGHGGTFGIMKGTHDIANKVGKTTASTVKRKNNKYMASDCPLAGKHIKQLAEDTNIVSDEAVHPIEIVSKSYGL